MITDMDDILTPVAKRHGIGLINASGLNMGLLTEAGPQDWHPAPPELREAGRQAVHLCRQRGADLSRVALRFCLDHPYAASTLVGMATVAQVERNLAMMHSVNDPELLGELRQIFAPVFNRTWPSGLPENAGPAHHGASSRSNV
jgi:L-galactose dehydrogenase